MTWRASCGGGSIRIYYDGPGDPVVGGPDYELSVEEARDFAHTLLTAAVIAQVQNLLFDKGVQPEVLEQVEVAMYEIPK